MIDSLTPVVTFERHPASIERHAEPAAVAPYGFDGITTWSPYYIPDEVEPPASVAEQRPLVEAPDGQDALPDNRPPPVPVRPAVVDTHPDPVVAAPVGPALETAPEPPAALPGFGFIPPSDVPSPPATSPVSDGPAPRPLFAGYRPTAPVNGPPLGRAPEGVVADFSSAALVRPSLPDDDDIQSLWEGMSVAKPLARRVRTRASTRSRLATGLALTALLAGAAFATLRYGPALLGSNQAITAVFNAPMMVIRAAASGRVVSVAATAAQIVDPQSPLLTIHTDDGKEDRPVFAGVHGMIRSVETVPGAALVSGAPLVRLQDCDRAFLTVPAGTKLKAGQTVQVNLSDQTVPGRVRNSAGVMEPPDSLVVGLEPGVMTAACPVGRSAAVTPVGS